MKVETPKRAWLLPGDDCGIWKAENNGSAEMAGAVEYVPVSELERLREALEELLAYDIAHVGPYAGQKVIAARAALKGDTP
jgi:hypothetical protein